MRFYLRKVLQIQEDLRRGSILVLNIHYDHGKAGASSIGLFLVLRLTSFIFRKATDLADLYQR